MRSRYSRPGTGLEGGYVYVMRGLFHLFGSGLTAVKVAQSEALGHKVDL